MIATLFLRKYENIYIKAISKCTSITSSSEDKKKISSFTDY